ncbi:MAG TPA: protein translocase subunit SecD [Gemmatimonadaceae bacterium]|nr:protein translocase subunit SecD [Gemmatimonadaceae bacterium]
MSNLQYRMSAIGALILLSGWALFPRTVIERNRRNGTFVTDTVKRVPLKKGLDLQGGMHLTLAVDESKGAIAGKSEALDRALKVVRTRIDQFGVAEPVVQKAGADRIIVELPGIDDERRATDVVQKAAFLQFQITDKTGAFERVIPRLDGIVKEKKLSGAAPTPDVRGDSAKSPAIKSLFTPKADTTKKKGDDSTSSTGPFSKKIIPATALGAGAMPGLFYVAASDQQEIDAYLQNADIQAALPPGKVLRWGADSVVANGRALIPLYALDRNPIITGEALTDAQPTLEPIDGAVVTFTLTNEGGRKFKNETGKHVKDNMAIVLDDRVMSAPVINSAIGTHGQITMGGKDLASAQDLAIVLRAGALPVPLKVEEVRAIGASLGADSVQKGITAGVIAVLLVVIIMLGYYRFAGMLAVFGLALYMLFTLAALAGFSAVLTLPGLAGFVLSIGIAVDANVLIFERIREEMVHGKSIRTSIDEGFKHAMSAIIDSNVSTALTAAVLYQYGTGPVKGFAVTLIAGIAASMISSIFVVKTFFLIWLNRNKTAETLSI